MRDYVYIKKDEVTDEYVIATDDNFKDLIYCNTISELCENIDRLFNEEEVAE